MPWQPNALQAARHVGNALNRKAHALAVEAVVESPPVPSFSGPAQCKVLGGVWGYSLQVVLFSLCGTSLLLKWRVEVPPRTLKTFALDIAKQCAGSLLYHVLNLITAHFLGAMEADECAWYWVNFTADSTIGLFLNYVLLRFSEWIFTYRSGDYREDDLEVEDGGKELGRINYKKWAKQIVGYCVIVLLSKLVLVLTVFATRSDKIWGGVGLNATLWIEDAGLRLLFVMVVWPFFLCTIFFWITDEFIRFVDDKKAKREIRREQAIAAKNAKLEESAAGSDVPPWLLAAPAKKGGGLEETLSTTAGSIRSELDDTLNTTTGTVRGHVEEP